jgi:hypothetical protein
MISLWQLLISMSSGLSGLSMVGLCFERIGSRDRWDGLASKAWQGYEKCIAEVWPYL